MDKCAGCGVGRGGRGAKGKKTLCVWQFKSRLMGVEMCVGIGNWGGGRSPSCIC
jgi:hypothetical protein